MIWMLEVPSANMPGNTYFINPALITKIVNTGNSCRVSFSGSIGKDIDDRSAIVGCSASELATMINKEYALIKAMEKAAA